MEISELIILCLIIIASLLFIRLIRMRYFPSNIDPSIPTDRLIEGPDDLGNINLEDSTEPNFDLNNISNPGLRRLIERTELNNNNTSPAVATGGGATGGGATGGGATGGRTSGGGSSDRTSSGGSSGGGSSGRTSGGGTGGRTSGGGATGGGSSGRTSGGGTGGQSRRCAVPIKPYPGGNPPVGYILENRQEGENDIPCAWLPQNNKSDCKIWKCDEVNDYRGVASQICDAPDPNCLNKYSDPTSSLALDGCANDYRLEGCARQTACISPSNKSGYDVTSEELDKSEFNVSVSCDGLMGYIGNPTANVCSNVGEEYTLDGCFLPKCGNTDGNGTVFNGCTGTREYDSDKSGVENPSDNNCCKDASAPFVATCGLTAEGGGVFVDCGTGRVYDSDKSGVENPSDNNCCKDLGCKFDAHSSIRPHLRNVSVNYQSGTVNEFYCPDNVQQKHLIKCDKGAVEAYPSFRNDFIETNYTEAGGSTDIPDWVGTPESGPYGEDVADYKGCTRTCALVKEEDAPGYNVPRSPPPATEDANGTITSPLDIDSDDFLVGFVSCAAGYEGTAVAAPCTKPGEPYTLDGCKPAHTAPVTPPSGIIKYNTMTNSIAFCGDGTNKTTEMEWEGVICDNQGNIKWNAMKSLDSTTRAGLDNSEHCGWERGRGYANAAWTEKYLGGCGTLGTELGNSTYLPTNTKDVPGISLSNGYYEMTWSDEENNSSNIWAISNWTSPIVIRFDQGGKQLALISNCVDQFTYSWNINKGRYDDNDNDIYHLKITESSNGDMTITAEDGVPLILTKKKEWEGAVCSRPAEITGYALTENNLSMDNFSVTGVCASGYKGTFKADVCCQPGGEYKLSGCVEAPGVACTKGCESAPVSYKKNACGCKGEFAWYDYSTSKGHRCTNQSVTKTIPAPAQCFSSDYCRTSGTGTCEANTNICTSATQSTNEDSFTKVYGLVEKNMSIAKFDVTAGGYNGCHWGALDGGEGGKDGDIKVCANSGKPYTIPPCETLS